MTLPLPQTTDGNPARPFRRGRASSVSTKKSIDAKNLVDAFQSDSRAHCVDRRGVGPESPAPAAASTSDVFERVRAGLVRLGFKRAQAEQAVRQVRARGVEPRPEPLLRAAIAVLTP